MAFIFKDLNKPFHRITTIPMENLDMLKSWLDENDILYGEGLYNMRWAEIIQNIKSNPQSFLKEGGWNFIQENDESNSSSDEKNIDSDYEVGSEQYAVITFGKDGAHEFLGRCLAVGACDADDGDVEAAAVLTRHVLVGLQCVGHEYHLPRAVIVVIHLLIADDGHSTTLVKRLCCKLVAVKQVALQCDENAAFRTVAAVGGDDGMLLVDSVKFLAVHILIVLFAAKVQK